MTNNTQSSGDGHSCCHTAEIVSLPIMASPHGMLIMRVSNDSGVRRRSSRGLGRTASAIRKCRMVLVVAADIPGANGSRSASAPVGERLPDRVSATVQRAASGSVNGFRLGGDAWARVTGHRSPPGRCRASGCREGVPCRARPEWARRSCLSSLASSTSHTLRMDIPDISGARMVAECVKWAWRDADGWGG